MAKSVETVESNDLSDQEKLRLEESVANQGHGDIPITVADEHAEVSGWSNTDVRVEPQNVEDEEAKTAKGKEVRKNAPETAVVVDDESKRQPS